MRVRRANTEPNRPRMSFEETWSGDDDGVVRS